MGKLIFYLPPFSSDYAGVCSALFDLNALVIINDASCCTQNYVDWDEPRWKKEDRPILCSQLRLLDAVLGDDEKVISRVVEAAGELNPPLIAVLGSPVPALIGMDMQGIAAEVEARCGIPSLGFSTTGFRCYDRGAADCMTALVRRFARREERRDGVNLLGLTQLDNFTQQDVSRLTDWLAGEGLGVNSSWFVGADVSQLERMGRASVNLVLSACGLPAARLMERKLGIPYVAGVPVGETTRRTLARRLRSAARGEPAPVPAGGEGKGGLLLIGDQVACASLREELEALYPGLPVTAAGFFAMDPALSRPGDLRLEGEEHLLQVLAEGEWTALAGDPLLCALPGAEKLVCVPLPHRAVSGPLYEKQLRSPLDAAPERWMLPVKF